MADTAFFDYLVSLRVETNLSDTLTTLSELRKEIKELKKDTIAATLGGSPSVTKGYSDQFAQNKRALEYLRQERQALLNALEGVPQNRQAGTYKAQNEIVKRLNENTQEIAGALQKDKQLIKEEIKDFNDVVGSVVDASTKGTFRSSLRKFGSLGAEDRLRVSSGVNTAIERGKGYKTALTDQIRLLEEENKARKEQIRLILAVAKAKEKGIVAGIEDENQAREKKIRLILAAAKAEDKERTAGLKEGSRSVKDKTRRILEEENKARKEQIRLILAVAKAKEKGIVAGIKEDRGRKIQKEKELLGLFKKEVDLLGQTTTGIKNRTRILNEEQRLAEQRDRSLNARFRREGVVAERDRLGGGGMGGMVSGGKSFFQQVFSVTAITRYLVVYRLAIDVMRHLSNAYRDVITTTVELDRIQGQISKVLPVRLRTEKNLNSIIQEAIGIARKYGSSITETAGSMTLFFQQGLNVEEAVKRTDAAMRLATVSTLKLNAAVEIQTAFLKTYGDSLKNAETLNDALLGVESKHAITANTLAEAFKGTASVAEEMGVSFERLLGMITAIGVRTRDAGSKIGTSLRFLLPRIVAEKSVSALETSGVNVFGVKNGVVVTRQMDAILGDLTLKWKTLNRTTRDYLAIIIAGRRRMNAFVTMMNAMAEEGLPATVAAYLSVGKAMESTAVITERLDRRTGQLTATWKKFAATLGTDVVKPGMMLLIDTGNELLGALDVFWKGTKQLAKEFNWAVIQPVNTIAQRAIYGPYYQSMQDYISKGKQRETTIDEASLLGRRVAGFMPGLQNLSLAITSRKRTESLTDLVKIETLFLDVSKKIGFTEAEQVALNEELNRAVKGRTSISKDYLDTVIKILSRELERAKTLPELHDQLESITKIQNELSNQSELLTSNTDKLVYSFTDLDKIAASINISLSNTADQMNRLRTVGKATSDGYTDLGMKIGFFKSRVSELETQLKPYDLVGDRGVTRAQQEAIIAFKTRLSGLRVMPSPGKNIDDLVSSLLGGESPDDLIGKYFNVNLRMNDPEKIKKAMREAQKGLTVSRQTDLYRYLKNEQRIAMRREREALNLQVKMKDEIAAVNREYKSRIDLLKEDKEAQKDTAKLQIEQIRKIEDIRASYGALSSETKRANAQQKADLLAQLAVQERLDNTAFAKTLRIRSGVPLEQARGQAVLGVYGAMYPDANMIKKRAKEEERILNIQLKELETSYRKGDIKGPQFLLKKLELEQEKEILDIKTKAATQIKDITEDRARASSLFGDKFNNAKLQHSIDLIGITDQTKSKNLRLDQIDAEEKLLLTQYKSVSTQEDERRVVSQLNTLLYERAKLLKELSNIQTVKDRERAGRVFESEIGAVRSKNQLDLLGIKNQIQAKNIRIAQIGTETGMLYSRYKSVSTQEDERRIIGQLNTLLYEKARLLKEIDLIQNASRYSAFNKQYYTQTGSKELDLLSNKKILIEEYSKIFNELKTTRESGMSQIIGSNPENDARIRRLIEIRKELFSIVEALDAIARTPTGEKREAILGAISGAGAGLNSALAGKDRGVLSILGLTLFGGMSGATSSLSSLAMQRRGIDANKLKASEFAKQKFRFQLEQQLASGTGAALAGGGRYAQIGASFGAAAGSYIPIPVVGTLVGAIAGGIIGRMLDNSETKEALLDNTIALKDNTQTLENLNERILGAPAGFTLPAGATTGLGIAGTGGSVIMVSQSQLENVIRNVFSNRVPTNNNRSM